MYCKRATRPGGSAVGSAAQAVAANITIKMLVENKRPNFFITHFSRGARPTATAFLGRNHTLRLAKRNPRPLVFLVSVTTSINPSSVNELCGSFPSPVIPQCDPLVKLCYARLVA